jgi:hypothetical protein
MHLLKEMKVLYINGYGRSGSTVIESLLSADKRIVAVGELRNLWLRAGLSYKCSCGSKILDCSFWGGILEDFLEGRSLTDFCEEVDLLRLKYDRIRRFSKVACVKSDEGFEEYISLYERLYTKVLEVTGAEVIVDSSKNPTHSKILSYSKSIRQFNVQLVRHPRAVVFSWSRKKIRKESSVLEYMPIHKAYKSATLWLLMNKQAESLPGSLLLRYEDFVNCPRDFMEKISRLMGFEFSASMTSLVHAGHTIGGNPVKFKKDLVISSDDEWLGRQSLCDSFMTWAITGRLAVRYGYRYGSS